MKDFKIILTGRKEICENTFGFNFEIQNDIYFFEAGQYAHFTLKDSLTGNDITRPVSIASSPEDSNIILTAMRNGSSPFIKNLLEFKTGSLLYLSKPSGNLLLDKDELKENIFIAGGIGVTPVRSIVEYASNKKLKNKITLFYSNINESQTAFLSDFEKWEVDNPEFKFIPSIEDKGNTNWKYESGRINSEMLNKHLDNFENKIFYIIGPPSMVRAIQVILLNENVSEGNIKSEEFR